MKCSWLLCTRQAEANKFCFLHRRYAPNEPRRKERVQIVRQVKKVAESRVPLNKEYKKIVKDKMKDSNECQIKIKDVCTKISSGLHHMRKRAGKDFLNEKYLIRSCSACNNYLEQFPLFALEKGFSLSKFSK